MRKDYLDKGITTITDKKKGKPRELLTKKQLAEIVKTVKEKTPKDYGIENIDQATDEFVNYLNTTTFNYSFPCISAWS